MAKKTRVFWRVIVPSTFSNIDTKTYKEAKAEWKKFGECPNGTPENKAYWKLQQSMSKIVRVTEIIEDCK